MKWGIIMVIFRSFNELKAHFFPKMVEDEKMQDIKKDIKKYAAYLANKSFDRVLAKDVCVKK